MAANNPASTTARQYAIREEINQARLQHYRTFLEQDFGVGEYQEKIEIMMKHKKSRLIVNLNDLRAYNPEETRSLMVSPMEHIPAFEAALAEVVNRIDPKYTESLEGELRIGFEGSFGAHNVNPRTLSARFLGALVNVEGIVTRCTLVRPKVVKSVHYCENTSAFHTREYKDATSPGTFMITSSVYPTEDQDGNPLTTEYGMSVYRDHQSIAIQEMPEKAPAGQLPRSIDIVLDEDLCDVVKPGDRVHIAGTYRAIPSKSGGGTSGVFRTVILANSIRLLGKESIHPTLTDIDINNIKHIGARRDCVDLLSRSLAPSIFGHENLKRALLLLLLGGLEKNLPNGTHIRGDINLLMVGDPSTAKSQLLRFVMNISPLAIATTGRGSSGVGLTAAVTMDRDSGERRLEAGAMVLADRGVVCIDEFDKMNDADRVAMHEVMEQQTVTIAKAGIHATLNARCSVVAAANPVYGQYNRQRKPMENIGLPDSLLSRFDLLFIVLDHMNAEHDRAISAHVLRMHQYRNPNDEEGAPVVENVDHMDEEENIEEDTPVFEKYNKFLTEGSRRSRRDKILTIPFLKKYMHYAKQRIKPTLSKEAADYISAAYAELRSKEDNKTLPVTARTLETLIRLATANAKARLSNTVDEDDAEAAHEMMLFALYNETEVVKRRKKRPARDGDSDESGDESKPKKSRKVSQTAAAPPAANESRKETAPQPTTEAAPAPSSFGPVTNARMVQFMTLLQNYLHGERLESSDIDSILSAVNQQTTNVFSLPEAEAILGELEGQNRVMYRDKMVFLI